MAIKDPFAEDGDSERTIIVPNPGGRRGAPSAAPAAPSAPVDASFLQSLALPKLNPLIVAALPLLDLVVRLKTRTAQENVEGLRNNVLTQVAQFERQTGSLGLPPQTQKGAKYVLCATIDDLVLNTPWGARSVWSMQSIVATVFGQTWGGDRFFDLLNTLKANPAVNLDLLEMIYVSLSLGFEGKYRVSQRGSAELQVLREDLYRVIRTARGEFERGLSPHWIGVPAAHRGLMAAVPLWVLGAVAAGILTIAFVGFDYFLNDSSDAVMEQFSALPPTKPVTLARAAKPLPPVQSTQAQRLRTFLAPEIQQGLVAVLDDASSITVRIRSSGMFPSGSAELQTSFAPLLQRIGEAINTEPGPLIVNGYSDNQPIQSIKYPSNWHLSLARAKAVETVVAQKVNDQSRITVDGKADANPIAPNDTPQGREQNRRTEIVLTKAI